MTTPILSAEEVVIWRLREGAVCDNGPCRVMNAASGCDCAIILDIIAALRREVERLTRERDELQRALWTAEASDKVSLEFLAVSDRNWKAAERRADRYKVLAQAGQAAERERGEALAVLEPFARHADAVSLGDALGHIERAHLMAARDLVAHLRRAETPTATVLTQERD